MKCHHVKLKDFRDIWWHVMTYYDVVSPIQRMLRPWQECWQRGHDNVNVKAVIGTDFYVNATSSPSRKFQWDMTHFPPSCLKKVMGHSLHWANFNGTFEIWMGHSRHGTLHPNHWLRVWRMLKDQIQLLCGSCLFFLGSIKVDQLQHNPSSNTSLRYVLTDRAGVLEN